MKALLAALFMFVVGDFAVNHGNGTSQAVSFGRHFLTSVADATKSSVFNQ